MEIKKTVNGESITVALSGRLDAVTAIELDKFLGTSLDGMTELIFDLSDLDYIASAGLRVLLATQKRMNKQGSMVLRHVKSEVNEVLEMTGFIDFLTVEK